MSPDERALLQRFLQDLVQTRGVTKDREAEGMILDALRASPDAAYVLVQHAIMSDQALHAAQDQIASLQTQLQSSAQTAPPARFSARGPARGPRRRRPSRRRNGNRPPRRPRVMWVQARSPVAAASAASCAMPEQQPRA